MPLQTNNYVTMPADVEETLERFDFKFWIGCTADHKFAHRVIWPYITH